MKDTATVTLTLDSKAKENARLLKIRVTFNREPRQYTANTDIRLTLEQFKNDKLKKTKEAKEKAAKALAIANEIAKIMGTNFTHARFSKTYRERLHGTHDMSTFNAIADLYINNPQHDLQLKTKSSYRTAVKWVEQFKHDAKLSDIDESFVSDLINYIKKRHLKENGKEMSENSIRIYLRALKAIYQSAITTHIVSRQNPFCNIIGQPLTSIQRQKGGMTDDEIDKFREYVPQTASEIMGKDFYKLSFLLFGMNIGDILSLKNKNIDNDVISFRRRKTRKYGSDTPLPLTEDAKKILNKYGKINASKPEEFILPYLSHCTKESSINNKIHDINRKINKGIASICEKTGIRHITLYTARHTFASVAASNGMTAEQIQKFLGHTSSRTTQLYMNTLTKNVFRKATKIVEDIAL